MAAPKELPLEVRRAAWAAVWRILLAPRSDDDPETLTTSEAAPGVRDSRGTRQ
jgi:hypothetical protein